MSAPRGMTLALQGAEESGYQAQKEGVAKSDNPFDRIEGAAQFAEAWDTGWFRSERMAANMSLAQREAVAAFGGLRAGDEYAGDPLDLLEAKDHV